MKFKRTRKTISITAASVLLAAGLVVGGPAPTAAVAEAPGLAKSVRSIETAKPMRVKKVSRSKARVETPKAGKKKIVKTKVSKKHKRVKAKKSTRKYLPDPANIVGTPRWYAAQKWAKSPKGIAVRMCESNYAPQNEVNGGVHYYGIWQVNRSFWLSNGGLKSYLPRGMGKFRASRGYQNYVAYRGYLSRGWSPWACA